MNSDARSIIVVNESSVVNDAQAWAATWALNYQLRWQFGPLWLIAASASYPPKGIPVPVGSSILHLLDTADQEGALGYHDEDGNEVPFGRVFVKTAQENGITFSEVLSHEGLELAADPHVNLTAFDANSGRLFAYEVGDPSQGAAYDLGAPYGRTTGILMSDFVKPSWFDDETPSTAITDYQGACTGPFSMGSGGYFSFATQLPPNWEQEMGEHAKPGVVDADDRVARRR